MNFAHNQSLSKAAFVGLFLLTGIPLVPSPVALAAGFSFSFFFGNPLPDLASRASKTLLKLSVIGLGFGAHYCGPTSALRTFKPG